MTIPPNRTVPIPLTDSIINDPNPKSRETMMELSGNAVSIELFETYLTGQAWGMYADVHPGHFVPIEIRSSHSHDDGAVKMSATIEQVEHMIQGLQQAVDHARTVRATLQATPHVNRREERVEVEQHHHVGSDGSVYVHHGQRMTHEVYVRDAATGEYLADYVVYRIDGGVKVELGVVRPEQVIIEANAGPEKAERVMDELIERAAKTQIVAHAS